MEKLAFFSVVLFAKVQTDKRKNDMNYKLSMLYYCYHLLLNYIFVLMIYLMTREKEIPKISATGTFVVRNIVKYAPNKYIFHIYTFPFKTRPSTRYFHSELIFVSSLLTIVDHDLWLLEFVKFSHKNSIYVLIVSR